MQEGAAARGLQLIEEPPVLAQRLAFVMDAFAELSTCRPLTMGGAGPIPWTAIMAYAQAQDMDDDEADRLRLLIRVMDNAFLDHLRKPANG